MANKKNDNGDVVDILAHDLKSPLVPVKGYADMLVSGTLGQINDQQKEALEAIQRGVDIMVVMIDKMLHMARLEAGRIKFEIAPVKIDELANGAIGFVSQFAESRKVKIEKRFPANLPELCVDKVQFQHVLQNLLHNALKHSRENGTVWLAAEKKPKEMCISVKDTGPGIEKSRVGKLFVKFYRPTTLDQTEMKGSGLGLYICKKIVEAHGGKIEVKTELGKGSVFTVKLPNKVCGRA